MKKTLVIVEDNYCRYFTAKQLIECGLRIKTETLGAKNDEQLFSEIEALNPDQLLMPEPVGAVDLVENLRARNINCRNSRIVFIITSELSSHASLALRTQLARQRRLREERLSVESGRRAAAA